MIHSIEIAFLFMPFKHLRLECEQMMQNITRLGTILTSDTSLTLEELFLSGSRFSGREAALLAINSQWVFMPQAKFLQKSKILLENVNNKLLSVVQSGRKSCRVNYDSLLSFEEKTDDAHAHNLDTVPLSGRPIKRTPSIKPALSRVPKLTSSISLYNEPLFSRHLY